MSESGKGIKIFAFKLKGHPSVINSQAAKVSSFVLNFFVADSRFLGNLRVTMDKRSSSVKLKGKVTRKMSSTASVKSPSSSSNNGGSNMVSVDFEVFGKVQGKQQVSTKS